MNKLAIRYHAHVIKVANEQHLVSTQLALFFEKKAFLTQDLPDMSPETMDYSRRCIEDCDFVILVVGDSYGQTNIAGVSQMHLSYLTAKAKRKPMLIFINANDKGTWVRQRQNFVNLVTEQNVSYITYYQHEQIFSQYLNNVYKSFEIELECPSWILSEKYAGSQGQASANVQSQLPVKVQPKPILKTPVRHNTVPSKVEYFAQKSINNTMDYKARLIDSQIDTEMQALSDLVAPREKPVTVAIDDTLKLEYLAHAYQAGNLKEVLLTETMSWRQILALLAKLNQPFSTDALIRSLNQVLSQVALERIQVFMPKAHAVSRCQLKKVTLRWILQQLCHNEWLKQSANTQVKSRELWQLTPIALKLAQDPVIKLKTS